MAVGNIEDSGILDKTHLRFFTKSSIVEMFEAEQFSIEKICGINAYAGVPNASSRVWTAFNLANTVLARRFEDMKYLRFAVVAKVRH